MPGGRGEDPTRLRAQASIAIEVDRTVCVSVDPGHSTDQGLRSWGVAHRGLWAVLQQIGRRIPSADHRPGGPRFAAGRETVWLHWANTAGPKARTADPSLEREYRRIKRAFPTGDTALLNSYGGVTAALKRAVEMQPAVEGRSFEVVIDGERTGQSQRLREARLGSV